MRTTTVSTTLSLRAPENQPRAWSPADANPALDAMLDPILVFDQDGSIVYVNRECTRLFGCPAEGLLGRKVHTLVPEDFQEVHADRLRTYLKHPIPERLGERALNLIQRADGTIVSVHASLAPFETASGVHVTVLLKQNFPQLPDLEVEGQLARSEHMARLGHWEEDGTSGRITWSTGMYDLLGCSPDTIPSTAGFLAHVHPDDLTPLLSRRNQARSRGGRWSAQVRLTTHRADPAQDLGQLEEQTITVSILGVVKLDEQGHVRSSSGTVQDISDRVELERRLSTSNVRLQTAFDAAPVGITLLDARPGHANMRLAANQAMARLAGMPMAEFLAGPVLGGVHPDDQDLILREVGTLLTGQTQTTAPVEARILHPDGQERWISTTGALVRDPDGNPDYIIAHVLDITDRRVAEAAARATAERDARIAAILQDGMHPFVPQRVGPIDIAHRYRPAGAGARVGGDWTDIFPLASGRIGIVVGDVRGHGIEAAVTMTQLRALVRMLATSGLSPAGVMRRLNDVINSTELSDDPLLSTIVHAQLDPLTGTLRYCSAGHLPLLVLPDPRGPQKCTVTPLPAIGGPPIGVLPDLKYTEQALELPPGSTLIGFTDGLIERRGRDLDQSLLDLQQSINELPPETLTDIEALADEIASRGEDSPTADDLAVIVLRFATDQSLATCHDDAAQLSRPSA